MNTKIERSNLLMLISTALLISDKTELGKQWLAIVREDVISNNLKYEHGKHLIKGYVQGLYAAGFIEHIDEIEFSELADTLTT